MKHILEIFIIATLICVIKGIFDEDACITPTGLYGRCILISQCGKLVALVKGTQADRERLKQYHCGFEGETPKVCCTGIPSRFDSTTTVATTTQATTKTSMAITATVPIKRTCYTLEAKPGTCVDVLKCPELSLKLIGNDMDYVLKSRCSGQGRLSVCCEKPWTGSTEALPTTTKQSVFLDRYFHHCQTEGLPDPSCCGVDSSNGNKIIHGEPASIDQYPWLAVIDYEPKKSGHLCGGSLISSRYVLTAAHCIVTKDKIDIGAKSVRLGEYDIINDGKDCVQVEGGGEDCNEGTSIFDIEEKIVHPQYSGNKAILYSNDIALLRLNDTAPYTDFIRPICLPQSDLTIQPPKDLRYYVAGWGGYDEYTEMSAIKLHADVPYVNFTYCCRIYRHRHDKNPIIWDKQLCAGGEFNRDTCKGDSGGPLMYFNGNKYELTGIISYGTARCGSEGIPSIYTNVHRYIPWIRKHVV